MKRMLTLTLAATLAMAGTVASAVEHIVRIEGPGYFPNKLYVIAGDTVRFENHGPYVARLKKTNGSWLTNTISLNGSTTISITNNNTIDLYGPYFVTGGGGYWGGTSYTQYGNNYRLKILNAINNPVPLSCPNPNAIC